MILTIDAGNSRTKWGIFDDRQNLIFEDVFNNDAYPAQAPSSWTMCQQAVVSCVAGHLIAEKIKYLTQKINLSTLFVQSSAQACGVENSYDQPNQLGTDRWAALIAAWALVQTPCVVVNAGTAVTVDAISAKTTATGANAQGIFMGGLILPGLQLMQNSLLDNTAQIKTNAEQHELTLQLFPTNTASAVRTGAVTAILGLIKAMAIQLQATRKEPISCILSGGDAAIFAEALNNYPALQLAMPVIIDKHLVLKGLLYLQLETSQILNQNNR